MSQPPKVSVLLPVYNGEQYLREAVDSILAQTFEDFELIAINDGSTDGSGAILDAYADGRMRVVHQDNMGLALTLNHAIGLARGQYLARQDADDISLPERLGKQVAFLDAHPGHALLGTWSTIIVGSTPTSRGHRHPSTNGALQLRGLFDSFFVHSSVMARRAPLVQAGAYPTDPQRNPPEDFDLWSRIARLASLANLPEALLVYREVPGSISRQKADLINQRVSLIALENLAVLLDAELPQPAARDLVAIARFDRASLSAQPRWVEIQQLLDTVVQRLVSRFPQEDAQINAEADGIGRRIRQLRLEQNRYLAPLAALLRRLRARLR